METIIQNFTENNTFFYFFFVMIVFALGDILGSITRAKVSSVFVVLTVFLVGFLAGVIPADVIDRAGLTSFAAMSAPILIFHMGTMINLKQLVAEWRTVVTAILGMVVVMIGCFMLVPIIGWETAIVAIPVLNGGIISTQIMSAAATELALPTVAAFAAIMYAVKKFAGAVPASHAGVQEAHIILEDYRKNKVLSSVNKVDENKRVGLATKYEKYFSDFVCLAITIGFAWLAVSLGKTFPSINYSLWALFFGALFGYLDLVPSRILEKGKSSGVFSMLVYVTIIPSLAKVVLGDLLGLGVNIGITLAVTIGLLYVVFNLLPAWKILGSKHLAFGASLCQYIGFPATFLISQEISKAVTDDKEEQQIVLDRILPSYLVAGMTTVTVLSIVVAGIFVNFL